MPFFANVFLEAFSSRERAALILTYVKISRGLDNHTCLCFCSRARVIAHAILQVGVRMCVGWCGLVCVCVLVCWLVCAARGAL